VRGNNPYVYLKKFFVNEINIMSSVLISTVLVVIHEPGQKNLGGGVEDFFFFGGGEGGQKFSLKNVIFALR
jgi:hypothetical protein